MKVPSCKHGLWVGSLPPSPPRHQAALYPGAWVGNPAEGTWMALPSDQAVFPTDNQEHDGD